MWLAVGPPSLRGYGGTFSGFQLRCASQAVFGGATPSGHALGSACLLGPVATARCFSEIKFCNGHIDRRIGWASTPGETPKELFEAWRPLLANYRKPAPAFVKERLKFRASAPARRLNRAPGVSFRELASSADVGETVLVHSTVNRGCLGVESWPPSPCVGELARFRNAGTAFVVYRSARHHNRVGPGTQPFHRAG